MKKTPLFVCDLKIDSFGETQSSAAPKSGQPSKPLKISNEPSLDLANDDSDS